MKKITSLISLLMVMCTLSFAQESTPKTGTIGFIGFANADVYVQSFTANVSTITDIGLWIEERFSEGEVKLAIYSDNAGVPNYGAPLYTGALIIAVTIGTKYYIGVFNDGIAGTSGSNIIGTSTTPTSTGINSQYSNDSGGSWATLSLPLAISINSAPAVAVPVSSWSIVLGSMLIGGFVFFKKRKLNLTA